MNNGCIALEQMGKIQLHHAMVRSLFQDNLHAILVRFVKLPTLADFPFFLFVFFSSRDPIA